MTKIVIALFGVLPFCALYSSSSAIFDPAVAATVRTAEFERLASGSVAIAAVTFGLDAALASSYLARYRALLKDMYPDWDGD